MEEAETSDAHLPHSFDQERVGNAYPHSRSSDLVKSPAASARASCSNEHVNSVVASSRWGTAAVLDIEELGGPAPPGVGPWHPIRPLEAEPLGLLMKILVDILG